jgi:hypothetical protein
MDSGIQPLLNVRKEIAIQSQIFTCIDYGFTEPEALEKLIDHGYRIKCYKKTGLHAKVWVIYHIQKPTVVFLGSSNLSCKATSTNLEANTRIVELSCVREAEDWLLSFDKDDNFIHVDLNWVAEYRKNRVESFANIDISWIAQFRKKQEILPLVVSKANAFDDKSLLIPTENWHQHVGDITFLAQGIPDGLKQATPNSIDMNRYNLKSKPIQLVLISKQNKLHIFESTVTQRFQIGENRKKVQLWISENWNFDTILSKKVYDMDTEKDKPEWEKWFVSTGRNKTDFQYEIAVSGDTKLPIVWLRPLLNK